MINVLKNNCGLPPTEMIKIKLKPQILFVIYNWMLMKTIYKINNQMTK